MNRLPKSSSLPESIDVHLSDVKMIREGHDAFLRRRGLYFESPMARHHRLRREAKRKLK